MHPGPEWLHAARDARRDDDSLDHDRSLGRLPAARVFGLRRGAQPDPRPGAARPHDCKGPGASDRGHDRASAAQPLRASAGPRAAAGRDLASRARREVVRSGARAPTDRQGRSRRTLWIGMATGCGITDADVSRADREPRDLRPARGLRAPARAQARHAHCCERREARPHARPEPRSRVGSRGQDHAHRPGAATRSRGDRAQPPPVAARDLDHRRSRPRWPHTVPDRRWRRRGSGRREGFGVPGEQGLLRSLARQWTDPGSGRRDPIAGLSACRSARPSR